MSYLIFCSFEVGGLPYMMAETLNRHGVDTYYVSLVSAAQGHNSTRFHFGDKQEPWDISNVFYKCSGSRAKTIKTLCAIKEQYGIQHCLAVGSESWMLHKANICYKYWSFGSDLDEECFKTQYATVNTPVWKIIPRYIRYALREKRARLSVQCADSLVVAPHQLDKLTKVVENPKLSFFTHILPTKPWNALLQLKKDALYRISDHIGSDTFFFSSTRHYWWQRQKDESNYKGNNLIIDSFSRYLELAKNPNHKLVLVNKGADTQHTRHYADQRGVADHVVWYDEMPRGELQDLYLGATVCFGQFGMKVLTGTVLEPMAVATPSISSFLDSTNIIPFYSSPPPVYNSEDPEVIAHFLFDIMKNSERRSKLGNDSWKWIAENCSEQAFVNSVVNS